MKVKSKVAKKLIPWRELKSLLVGSSECRDCSYLSSCYYHDDSYKNCPIWANLGSMKRPEGRRMKVDPNDPYKPVTWTTDPLTQPEDPWGFE